MLDNAKSLTDTKTPKIALPRQPKAKLKGPTEIPSVRVPTTIPVNRPYGRTDIR